MRGVFGKSCFTKVVLGKKIVEKIADIWFLSWEKVSLKKKLTASNYGLKNNVFTKSLPSKSSPRRKDMQG